MAGTSYLKTAVAIFLLFLLTAVSATAHAKIIYVDDDAAGANNGSSWPDAYNYLQDALAAAQSGDEVRVAQGTYKPDQGAGQMPGDRTARFQLKNSFTIKGGFAGFGQTDPDARDISLYETILSGDLNGDDDTVGMNDNSFCVVYAHTHIDTNTVLDGLIITAGYAVKGYSSGRGAGLSTPAASPTVVNCTFTGNYTLGYSSGGAGINTYNGSPVISGCTFRDNHAEGYDSRGAGFCNYEGSPVVTDCTFIENTTVGDSSGGAGIRTYSGSAVISNCTFRDNQVQGRNAGGAGLWNYRGPIVVTNCEFIENTVVGDESGGAGLDNYEGNITVTDCSFIDNIASERASSAALDNHCGDSTITRCTFKGNHGARYGGGLSTYDGSPTVTYCTFIGNSAEYGAGFWSFEGSPIVSHCTFIDNNSLLLGGAIYNFRGSPTMSNCLFAENSSEDGAAFWTYYGAPNIINCTITSNTATQQGGAIWSWDATLNIINSILWKNIDETGDAVQAQIFSHSGEQPISHSWIDRDPLFLDPENGYYHLNHNSPCINAGDPNYVAEPDETDLDGKPRVIGGRIDMGPYESRVIYVDDDAAGANDGLSWINAYNYLQDALITALSGDEIWVAQGIYKPDHGAGITPGDREATFQLINGVTLKGGYAGFGQTDPDARDIELYETILTGDLNGDDVAVNDPCDLPAEPTKAENSYHVVTGTGTDKTSILDGFTITGGNANGPHDPYRFERGGGMYCNAYSSPTVINCTFRANIGIEGGGLHIYWDNNMMLTNCAFIGNYASHGGGMAALRSRATLTNCAFSGNTALDGGGMYNQDGGPTLTNCTFSANAAVGSGGGIDNFMSSPILTNCTLTGNSAEYGGAINSFLECTTVVTNSILWANTAAQGSQICLEDDPHYSSDASISYCNIEGGITGVYVGEGWRFNWGQGNIDVDPLFRDSDGIDNIPGTEDDNLRLSIGSPCIDAGDPNYIAEPNETDLDGKPRVLDGDNDGVLVVDMGAYELPLPPLEVNMKFVPKSLNLVSKGKWIKAHFVLPEPLTVEDVDTSRPAEIENLNLQSEYMEVFVNEDGLVVVRAVFERSLFCDVGPFEGKVAVIGFLKSGRLFRGTDTIRIMNNNLKYLGLVASHWLAADCAAPGWCSGADLDQDSVVNFIDFAMLGGCCFEVIKD